MADLARKSEAAAACIKFGIDTDYWLSDSELFSRVYAQWVAQKGIDTEISGELQSILSSTDKWQQFNNHDWQEIQKVMDALMKKKGWL